MMGKKMLLSFLCAAFFVVTLQAQKREEPLPEDISSAFPLASLLITDMFRLEELAKPYCEKHTDILPIRCGACKERRLTLREFSGCLSVQALKAMVAGESTEKMKIVYDNFLELLTAPDTQELAMVDFVLKELEGIEYPCAHCGKVTWWERMLSI